LSERVAGTEKKGVDASNETQVTSDNTDWWVDQHWKIRSTRAANGLPLFLNFSGPAMRGRGQAERRMVDYCVNMPANRTTRQEKRSRYIGSPEGTADPESGRIYSSTERISKQSSSVLEYLVRSDSTAQTRHSRQPVRPRQGKDSISSGKP